MERFKKGTKVVCLDTSVSSFTKGKIYEVSKVSAGTLHFEQVNTPRGDTWWIDKFIPVSEIEPFAVRHNNVYEFDELKRYGEDMGLFKLGTIENEVPHRVYFNTMFKSHPGPYFGTGSYKDRFYRELTFEQFKNNEHLMNTKTNDCCSNDLRVSPEFVKEAHRAACADWKKKIEEQFPSLFPNPTFKIGDRLKIKDFGGPWLLTAIDYLKCSIVNIETGCHFGTPFSVKDTHKIEIKEIGMPNYIIEKA